MRENKEALLLLSLMLAVVGSSFAEVFYNIVKQDDVCLNRCKDTPLPNSDREGAMERDIALTCCQRGCRFFNLVDWRRELEPNQVNNTLDACEASCTEAYSSFQDFVTACRVGCAYMANVRMSGISLFSIAIHIEDGVHPNILLMSPDIPDNDVINDAGLGKEILPGWWDSNGFKLPETYFKTVPVDSGAADYSVSSEYLGDNEKATTVPGSDWLECASRHTGIPRWLLILAIATAALSALWLYLYPEKSTESIDKITLVKPSAQSKVTIYLPDEAPLYKKPPPKYSEVVDTNDPNLQA